MRHVMILAATFAAAFAIGRYLPAPAGRSSARAPASVSADGTAAPGANGASTTASHAGKRPPVPSLSPRPNPRQTPWIAHVAFDPEHHAADTLRVQDAVFGDAEAITELDACRHLFEPMETRLQLRMTIKISQTAIDIGPAERVEVVDGVEISEEARACVLSAFRRAKTAKPTHPDDVRPYHGPFDLVLTVVGDRGDSSGEGS